MFPCNYKFYHFFISNERVYAYTFYIPIAGKVPPINVKQSDPSIRYRKSAAFSRLVGFTLPFTSITDQKPFSLYSFIIWGSCTLVMLKDLAT